MSRLLLLVLAAVILLGVILTVVLGAFPPAPQVQQIQRVLPNDRFSPAR